MVKKTTVHTVPAIKQFSGVATKRALLSWVAKAAATVYRRGNVEISRGSATFIWTAGSHNKAHFSRICTSPTDPFHANTLLNHFWGLSGPELSFKIGGQWWKSHLKNQVCACRCRGEAKQTTADIWGREIWICTVIRTLKQTNYLIKQVISVCN